MCVKFTQTKKRLTGAGFSRDEVCGAIRNIVVYGLHSLSRKRTCVCNRLLADSTEPWVHCRVVDVGCLTVHNSSRTVLRAECRVLWVVPVFRFFLGVEVVQITVKFIEAMDRWQKFIAVAKVVLAKLTGCLALALQQHGDRWVFFLQSYRGTGQTDLGKAGSHTVLSRDERRSARRTALLRIIIGE